MAVVGMKLVSIVGPLAEFDGVVSDCLVGKGFHPEDALSFTRALKGHSPFAYKNPYGDLLKQGLIVSELSGIAPDYHDFKGDQTTEEEISLYFLGIQKRIFDLTEEKKRLEKLLVEDEHLSVQLAHYGDIDVKLEDLFEFTYAEFRFGRIPIDTYKGLGVHLKENRDCFFFPSSMESDYIYGMYFAPRAIIQKVDAVFNSFHFERIHVDGRVTGRPQEAIETLRRESVESKNRLAEIEEELHTIKEKERDRFLTLYSKVRAENDIYDIRQYASHTEDSFYLIGWIPESGAKELEKKLTSRPEITFSFEHDAKNHKPPTKLKNKRIFRPFEFFVEMYGLPNYHELDPTPLMAISFTLLFGLMFGDVGQGLLLFFAGFLLHKKGMALGRIITYAGFSSTICGFLYGSVFGYEDIISGFHPLENSTTINITLVGGIITGVVFITVAIILNIVNGVRQKDLEKAVFSANGVAGFVLYWAILLAAIGFLMGHSEYISTAFIICLVVVPLLLIFLKEPLGALSRKCKEWIPKKKGEYILVNLIELFDVLLSFLTNTISFVRVGMFALNHAIMMMVVFTLANLSGNSTSIPVVVIGNLFVMLLEGLIVGIQVMRLNFYEMFSRFYEGNGVSYKPFEINYKNAGANKNKK